MSSGSIVCSGKIRLSGWPAPTAWKGQTGNIVFTIDTGKTITFPVIVTEAGIDFDETKEDSAGIVLSADVTGEATYDGWLGTQPTATDPSKADQEQWEGTSKTIDPNGLQSSAVRLIDVWGTLTDSDSAEVTKLTTVISAAASALPMTDMKVRMATFARDALDGGTISINFGTTSTKDDVQMPATVYDVDSVHSDTNYIFGQVQIRKVQADATISWPTTPTQPANLKQGKVSKVQLNDGNWALTYNFVRNTTEDAIEVDGAHTSADPNDLDETATIIVVTNTATPSAPVAPVGLLISTDTQPLTVANGSYTGYWRHVYQYGPSTRLQAIQFRGSYNTDPSHINDTDVQYDVSTSSTPPSTPAPRGDVDLKLVRQTAQRIQGTVEKWLHTWEFARNTAEDQLEHNSRRVDPDDLGETERIPIVHTSPNSSPGTPAQVGTASNLIGTDVERLTVPEDAYTGLWLWTFSFGNTTRKQEIEQDGEIDTDPDDLTSGDFQTLVSNSDTIPSAPVALTAATVLVRVKSRKFQNTPEKWRHTFYFDYRGVSAKLEADKTETNLDTSALESTATTADVWQVSGGAPSTPTLSGYVLRFKHDVETNNPAYRLRIYRWGLTTTQNDIEMGGSNITDCQSDIADAQIIVVVTASATPSNPGTPTGLKYREVITKQLNSGKWRHEHRYARNNREDDIEFGDTFTLLDSEAIESGGAIAIINTSATPPADPGAPATDTKLVSTTTKQIHGAATPKYVHIFKYGVRTSQQDIEWLKSQSVAEAGALKQEEIVVSVTSSSTPGSGTNPDSTNLSLYWSQSHRITDTQYVHLHAFRPFTVTEEIEEDGIVAIDDPVSALVGDGHQRDVTSSATPPSVPAVSGRVCVKRTTKRIGKVRWQHDWYYDFRNNEAAHEAKHTRTKVDVSALQNEAVTADVWLVSGGAPSTPTLADYVLTEYEDREIENPLYRLRIYSWGLLTNQQAIEYPTSPALVDVFGSAIGNTGEIVSTASSLYTLAAAEPAAQTSKLWRGTKFVRKTPAKVLKTVEYSDDDYACEEDSYQELLSLPFLGATVFVSLTRQNSSGLWEALVEPFLWPATRGTVILRRYYYDTIGDIANPTTLQYRNNANFLGYPAGWLKFSGRRRRENMGRSGDRQICIDWKFSIDSLLHYAGATGLGWQPIGSDPGIGFANASSFGWTISVPTMADFSAAFLT